MADLNKSNWKLPASRQANITDRRKIRYRLFRIREGNDAISDDLKAYIEQQFRGVMNWHNFTFEWDVSVNDPLKVIQIHEWTKEGGMFDPVTGGLYPSAFTKQKE